MKVINNELTIDFDVDGTLILWGNPNHPDAVPITDPHTQEIHMVVPHKLHCQMVKHHKHRGYFVTVHSNGGFMWANNVVRALGLTGYVDLVKTKSIKMVDDEDISHTMGKRIYIEQKI